MKISIFILFFMSIQLLANNIETIKSSDRSYINEKINFGWGSDPFLKTPGYMIKEDKTLEVITLEAVLYSEDDPMAIIDGEAVAVSALVKGYRVTKIGKNFVVLKKGRELRQLVIPSIKEAEEPQLREISSEKANK